MSKVYYAQSRSAAIVRFDSDTKEDATFEESNVEKQTKPSKKLKKKRDTLQTQPLPEVSAERYYQTTDLLDIGKGSEVSLRSLFGFSSQNEEPTEIDRPTSNKHVFFKEPEKPIKQEVKEVSEQSGYWKNAGMWHEPVFFPSGDIRFKGKHHACNCKLTNSLKKHLKIVQLFSYFSVISCRGSRFY